MSAFVRALCSTLMKMQEYRNAGIERFPWLKCKNVKTVYEHVCMWVISQDGEFAGGKSHEEVVW